ncbi:MAG: hypothetical protein ACRDF6_10245, partial [bacterium]
MTGSHRLALLAAAGCGIAAGFGTQNADRVTEAARHHRSGVEHHLRRSLDDASREYARTLQLDPPREPTPAELEIARR